MPQQTIIATKNSIIAARTATFRPKNGMINKPTSGKVHSQRTRANAISSKCEANRLSTAIPERLARLYVYASGVLSAIYRVFE